MREHVRDYEEAKIVLKQYADETIQNKENNRVYKLRALWTSLVELGVATAIAGMSKQPLVIPGFIPLIGVTAAACLSPIIVQRIKYNSIKNDSYFKNKKPEDIIRMANTYIDQKNEIERIRGNFR
jgi:hypothetical protein